MRELLYPAHVLAHGHLDRRDREQPAIERAILLTWIALDVVEVHSRQTALGRLEVHLEVLVAHGAQSPPRVVRREVASRVALAEQEQGGLIDAISWYCAIIPMG